MVRNPSHGCECQQGGIRSEIQVKPAYNRLHRSSEVVFDYTRHRTCHRFIKAKCPRHITILASQTIDSPILIFDYWELSDTFLALAIIPVFRVVLYSWRATFVLLVASLRRSEKTPRGIFFAMTVSMFANRSARALESGAKLGCLQDCSNFSPHLEALVEALRPEKRGCPP